MFNIRIFTTSIVVKVHNLYRAPIYPKLLLMMMATVVTVQAAEPDTQSKELWQAYTNRFYQMDGRILDSGIDSDTTSSEAQAYTLFMSLVVNDRTKFDTLLTWTETHLAQKNLKKNLPGWNWGKRSDGIWILLDTNPASDADLWLAYTLFQAGTLWNEPQYTHLARAILRNIKQNEIVQLPNFGTMLLPAPKGFDQQKHWRLNPSYLPLQLIRYFQKVDPYGPWKELADNTLKMFQTFPRNIAPDWAIYSLSEGWTYGDNKWSVGSYDAIRTYLWAGMLNHEDKAKPQLISSLKGMLQVIKITQVPPHKIDIIHGDLEIGAPPGFSAAIIPYLISLNEIELTARQKKAINEQKNIILIGKDPQYYDQILALFALGWDEGTFSFALDGSLKTAWHK